MSQTGNSANGFAFVCSMTSLTSSFTNISVSGYLNGPNNTYSGIIVTAFEYCSNVSLANVSSSANVTNFQQAGLVANVVGSAVAMAGVSVSGSWVFVQNYAQGIIAGIIDGVSVSLTNISINTILNTTNYTISRGFCSVGVFFGLA